MRTVAAVEARLSDFDLDRDLEAATTHLLSG
jgi:hypothetical protein